MKLSVRGKTKVLRNLERKKSCQITKVNATNFFFWISKDHAILVPVNSTSYSDNQVLSKQTIKTEIPLMLYWFHPRTVRYYYCVLCGEEKTACSMKRCLIQCPKPQLCQVSPINLLLAFAQMVEDQPDQDLTLLH